VRAQKVNVSMAGKKRSQKVYAWQILGVVNKVSISMAGK
jgi:hypothetical protein